MDREKVIKALEDFNKKRICLPHLIPWDEITDALALLKEQELPEELKYKMWNALYAEEDRFEKKYIGTDEHDAWFNTYRPWLQRGFDIAIKAIADWEGR